MDFFYKINYGLQNKLRGFYFPMKLLKRSVAFCAA